MASYKASTSYLSGAENAAGKAYGVTTRGAARRALGSISNGAGHSASSSSASEATTRVAPAAAAGSSSAGVLEADAAHSHDPQYFTDYVNEIHDHYRSVEERKTARHGYMAHQTDVNAKMRAILVDWLLEVHFKFKLLPETLYLTVNIIDRYLERKPVVRTKLQLVGVTAMLVASKYEEIYPPEVKDFVFITSNAYSHEEILDMEARMLNALRFEVTVPTAWIFLGRYCKVAMLDTRTKLLAQYYVERCLQEYDMLRFLPSLQASAAVHAAMRTLGTGTWTPTMVAYTGFTEADLAEPLAEVERYVCHHSASLKASRKKFGSKRFHDIASVGVACADGTIAGATAPRA
ncbi:hypothetical protein FNF27_07528 [Cafeteria roenbergensis]|uniref:Uncharacterized protein n=1 Tax=Cafeteria roenbergensis TaxID=33653 RepID=A0A5A8DQI9_CAFRO|nr:hypothetical protein FNF29_02785 [Cafeteria roenbergensis]KAA0166366.1 hypothetical protein FNF27_07528 [Cafeteria roenbergensis]KAA0166897.1 hypothetical protein FNF31_01272 [Cafeteria roenbergensis]KAA0169435.1 hypothetical protein FNF28_02047 [Cafeteria roenbergensis]|mmetsp:Transcript_7377/g.29499  ORF Transcript_7377/g.29499 Transcript_7377/m.29499 type:complete len:348 (-) Transcript_7377:373-1416(-)|eukprot:KAA0154165.1 hypothetical protein FNF29_02785 [Cafeteria roenbergensis]